MTELSRILARPKERLTTHSLRVLERIEQLAALRAFPEFPRLWWRLRYAALLHDSGKLAPGFQQALRSPRSRWGLRHEALSLAFVQWFDFGDDLPWVVAAIATHHRDASFILDMYRPRHNPTDDLARQLLEGIDPALVREWYNWLAVTFAGLSESPARRSFSMPAPADIHAALAGFRAWLEPIQKHGSAHPDFVQAVLLRGGILLADHAASAQTRPFSPLRLEADSIRQRIGPDPYPHQITSGRLAGSPVLLIAPTGAGKTEAALCWAGQAPAQPARLLYLLPYRASMDAMARRLEGYAPVDDIGLQHGRALQSLYRRLLSEGQGLPDAIREATARLNVTRLHACPIRVSSPYHLLRNVYQLKGFEAALTDLYGSLIIVDEIHVYDAGRLAVIIETLSFLRRCFAIRPLIMTATLPPLVADKLREALPGLLPILADVQTFASFQRHRIHLRPGDLADDLPAILAEQHAGRAVLVTVNTVRRARAIGHRLSQAGAETLILHSRFNARDRWQHEQALLTQFGVGMRDVGHAGLLPIVVATQVIEVSLNLDFDVLFSDPSPLEALIQRCGRVNRQRPPRGLAPAYVYNEPTGLGERHPIYDPTLVSAALDILRQFDGQPMDEARITDWLDRIYQGEIAVNWQARYTAKQEEFRRVVLNDLSPFQSADDGLFRAFSALFDGIEVLPLVLEDEYRAALEHDPIGASMLLVPLAWWQYAMLMRQGRAWPGEEEGLYFVDVPYTEATGLQLEDDQEE